MWSENGISTPNDMRKVSLRSAVRRENLRPLNPPRPVRERLAPRRGYRVSTRTRPVKHDGEFFDGTHACVQYILGGAPQKVFKFNGSKVHPIWKATDGIHQPLSHDSRTC